jgi:hypothetical protein
MILNTVKIKIKPVVTTISELKLQCQRSMNLWYIFSGLKNCILNIVMAEKILIVEDEPVVAVGKEV